MNLEGEEEMRSPAYESIMLAAQNVVYDTQVEEREVLLAAIGAVITNVSCRVLQAIEPSIQSMTIKHGDQTSNSFTALLGETQKTFERYSHEMRAPPVAGDGSGLEVGVNEPCSLAS